TLVATPLPDCEINPTQVCTVLPANPATSTEAVSSPAKPGQLMLGFLTRENDFETILKIVRPFRTEIFLLSVIANIHYSGTSVIFKHFKKSELHDATHWLRIRLHPRHF